MKTSSGLLLVTLFTALGAAHAVEYRLTSLPVDPAVESMAFGINNYGAVVGAAKGRTNFLHGVVWEGNTARYLPVQDHTYGNRVRAINDNGAVAGNTSGAHGQSSAFVWDADGSARRVPYSALNTYGIDINASGTVVANYYNGGYHHAVRWDGADILHLDPLSWRYTGSDPADPSAPLTLASALNDLGHVVGWSNTADHGTHAVIWRDGQVVDVHGPQGIASAANDINNAGQILMTTTLADGSTRAGIRTADSVAYFDVVYGGSAEGVSMNAHGTAVGWSGVKYGDRRAVLWQDGGAFDLNALVTGGLGELAYLEHAYGINDSGQIVGSARTADGGYRAFLLTPVPEPGQWIMLLGGSAIVLICRRARCAKDGWRSTKSRKQTV